MIGNIKVSATLFHRRDLRYLSFGKVSYRTVQIGV